MDMIILPAIDLYGGKVVRLKKGDFADKTDYGRDPLEMARDFADAGCRHLHVVDLEGAESGSPKHLGQLSKLRELGLDIEYGGGLRTIDAISDALEAGASSVMVGSLISRGEKSYETAAELFARFGNAITPSIDVRGGRVEVSGWKERTGETPSSCLERLCVTGYRTFLVTSIERDGMLTGPDLALYGELERLAGNDADIIAAGGVTTLEDIKGLRDAGLYGAVVGKAIYETGFDLAEAVAISRGGRQA
jgi:phosphoribosylformimino-5-aminoimidazole carboxamide ribotide isomerase